MSAQLIAVIIDNLISIVGGIVAILIGFRVIGPKPEANPKFDTFYAKMGKHLKWLGPLIILFALTQIGFYFHDNP